MSKTSLRSRILLRALAAGLLAGLPAQAAERGMRVVYRAPAGGRQGLQGEVTIYERSHAVVIGIDRYQNGLSELTGAVRDAALVGKALEGQGFEVTTLVNEKATKEAISEILGDNLRNLVGKEDRVLVFFAGHGTTVGAGDAAMGYLMPVGGKRGKEVSTGISMREMVNWFEAYEAKHVMFVADACYSGLALNTRANGLSPATRGYLKDVTSMPVRLVLVAGGRGQQANEDRGQGLFTKFFLEGMGGAADFNSDGIITSDELAAYVKPNVSQSAMSQFSRRQNPQLGRSGEGEFVFLNPRGSGSSAAPAQAAAQEPPAKAEGFHLTPGLPVVPVVAQPPAVEGRPSAGAPHGGMDPIAGLERYDAAVRYDKGRATADDKAANWRRFAREVPAYGAQAEKRAAEWERYAAETRTAAMLEKRRIAARDADWAGLKRILALSVVPEPDKRAKSKDFFDAYGKSPGIPAVIGWYLRRHLPPGSLPEYKPADLIDWIDIPGGAFVMGSEGGDTDERPVRRVAVKPFQLARSEVTVAQYRACVDAGACTAPDRDSSCNWGVSGRESHPVNCIDWNQARAFARWVGGRLPAEAEWEYAARSAGKAREYPWGNAAATCERAVMDQGGNGCGMNSTWPVCSKAAGNTEQGLCDMAGSVWEWTQDWYHASYKGAPKDSSAWERPAGSYRADRGGSWLNSDPRVMRVSVRGYVGAGGRRGSLGARVAR